MVTNFTPVTRDGYRIPLPKAGKWREIVNTDAGVYGGSNTGNGGAVEAVSDAGDGSAYAIITVPPLGTVYFEHLPG